MEGGKEGSGIFGTAETYSRDLGWEDSFVTRYV